ncbi:MAG: PilZ domain-containing protein [Myxococcota bacterium]
MELTPPNTRRAPRTRLSLAVADKRSERLGVTRDVSFEGMFIHTTRPHPVGTRCVLKVQLPGIEVAVEVAAEVVRTEEGGMGVRLIHAVEAQRSYFAGQLARLSSVKN